MQLNPPLREARRFPAATLTALAAIVLSILWWIGTDLDALVATRATIAVRPWTILSSTLLHLDLVHLLFNLSWWWPLATRIEFAWGTPRLIGITILLALLSGGSQIAFSNPGVGLSGVIYGLFAMLAVAHSSHPVFRGLITRKTVQLMAFWFVLCVVLTWFDVWRVGNVAHGVGAAAGWLLGRCITASPRARNVWIAALAAVGIITGAALTTNIPWLRNTHTAGHSASLGAAAYQKGNFDEAARQFEAAHAADPSDAEVTMSLGIVYQKLGRHDDALRCYQEAAAGSKDLHDYLAPAIASILSHKAYAAYESGEYVTAHEYILQTLSWAPDDRYARSVLKTVRERLSLEPKPQ